MKFKPNKSNISVGDIVKVTCIFKPELRFRVKVDHVGNFSFSGKYKVYSQSSKKYRNDVSNNPENLDGHFGYSTYSAETTLLKTL